jgi:hypothetical protein
MRGRLEKCKRSFVKMPAAGACQPADDPAVLEASEETGEEVAARPSVPAALDELIAETDAVAAEWQDDVRAVEVLIHLTPEREATRARVTYLAAQADRFLTVEIDERGTSEERPTLATMGLYPVDPAGIEAIPSLPEGAEDPDDLAESAAPVLDECGFDTTVDSVLYTSGAPAAWDGQRWAGELGWTATARSGGGNAVTIDPVDGTPADDPCVVPAEGA